MDAGMRGTNAAQDSRFKDKEAASIKNTKFPKHFSEKVDLRKVNLSVLRGWIAQKVTELIKFEDDVVVEYVFGMLEDKEKPIPDPRKLQVSLIGFMDKHGAAAFMDALWSLLLSAQSTVGGVPAEFIEAKKKELQAKQEQERAVQERNYGRPSAQDSFDDRRGDGGLPSRPGPPPRRSPPPRQRDDYRPRDDGYRPRDRDRGDEYRSGPRGGRGFERERDNGYGSRGGPGGGPGAGRPRSRSRSPGRGYGYRRRSPSPRRRESPPRRRRSPSPARRRSPSPRRERNRSVTPPLRERRVSPDVDMKRRDGVSRRSLTPTPPRKETARGRPRSRSRTPTPSDPRSDRSRSRSPTVTPPRRRAGRSSTPPRRRSGTDSSPVKAKRRRDGSASPGEVVKKGRGQFTDEADDKAAGKSRWD